MILTHVCMYAYNYTCVYSHMFTVSLFVDLIMLLDAAIQGNILLRCIHLDKLYSPLNNPMYVSCVCVCVCVCTRMHVSLLMYVYICSIIIY